MNNNTQNNILKPYFKVNKELLDCFEAKNLSRPARHIHTSLGYFLGYDSSEAHASYEDISRASLYSSSETVSMALAELIDKGMIRKIGKGRYKLLQGIYMGIIENENKTVKVIPSSPSQKQAVISATEGKKNPPIYSTNNTNNNKSRHEEIPKDPPKAKPDDISKLRFKEKSPFKTTSRKALWDLIRRYGVNSTQDIISKMDKCYSIGEVRESPDRLLYAAMTKGTDWKYKPKDKEMITLKYPTYEDTMDKIQKDINISQKTNAKKIEIETFKKKNPILIQRFTQEIQKESPRVAQVESVFAFALRSKIIESIQKGEKNEVPQL